MYDDDDDDDEDDDDDDDNKPNWPTLVVGALFRGARCIDGNRVCEPKLGLVIINVALMALGPFYFT
jgi:hypothetical protein